MQWTEIVQWLIWFYLKVPQRIFTFSNTARDLPLNKEVEGSGYEIKGMKSSMRKQPRGKFMSTNQKQYPDLGNDASSVWNSCSRFSVVIWRETSGSVAKCQLFSQARWNIEGKDRHLLKMSDGDHAIIMSSFLFFVSWIIFSASKKWNIEMSSPILSWQPYDKHKTQSVVFAWQGLSHLHNVCQTQT